MASKYGDEYKRIRRNLLRKINAAEKRGWSNLPEVPSIPKRITAGSIRRLEKISENIYKKAYLVTPDLEVKRGEKGRSYEASRAAKKAAETREVRRIIETQQTQSITPKDVSEVDVFDEIKYTPQEDYTQLDLNGDETITYSIPQPEPVEPEESRFPFIPDRTDNDKEPGNEKGDSDTADEYLKSIEQLKDYIDMADISEANYKDDDKLENRKGMLFTMLNAAERDDPIGLAFRLRKAAEKGILDDIINTALFDSDRPAGIAMVELANIISGRTMTPDEARELHEIQVKYLGYDPNDY